MILIEGNNAGEFYTTWNVYCFQPFVLPTFGSSNRSYKVACTFHLGHVSLGLTPTSTRCFISRSSRSEIFCKKDVLRISQNSQEDACARVSFLINLQEPAWNFIKKETLAQVFSCEFCENTFFIEHLWWLLLYFIKKWNYQNELTKNENFLTWSST